MTKIIKLAAFALISLGATNAFGWALNVNITPAVRKVLAGRSGTIKFTRGIVMGPQPEHIILMTQPSTTIEEGAVVWGFKFYANSGPYEGQLIGSNRKDKMIMNPFPVGNRTFTIGTYNEFDGQPNVYKSTHHTEGGTGSLALRVQ